MENDESELNRIFGIDWVDMMMNNKNVDDLIKSFDSRMNKLMDEREEDI